MAKKQTGCLEVLVGLGVLWALPGAILDECSSTGAPVGNPVAPVRSPDWGAVEEAEVPEIVTPVDPVAEYDAEIKRRFRASAPWAR